MAVTTLPRSGITGYKTKRIGGLPIVPAPWVRPGDWLPMPSIGSEQVVGLHAVYPGDANFVSFTFAGAVTVDWGDGTAPQNIASGVQAYHNITFASVPSATLTSGGYRQALISVTPQAGQHFTSINLNKKHNQTGLSNGYCTGWLDIVMAGTLVTSFVFSDAAGTNVTHRMLQRFNYVGANSLTGGFCNSLFRTCAALQSVSITTTGCTDFSAMFYGCQSLTTIPLLDTSAGVTFTQMFTSCYALMVVPLLNTAAGTNFTQMFSNCYALTTIPLLNTAAGVTFTQMFSNCYALTTVPLLDTSRGQQFGNMFASCYSLITVPLFDTSAGINFGGMFSACLTMTSVPLLNTAAGTSFIQMFGSCTSLTTLPLFDTSAGINFSTMVNNCQMLTSVPLFNTAAGTNFTSMFNNCLALVTVPLLNTAAVVIAANFATMFLNCFALQVAALAGTSLSISYAGCKLSAAQINAIYTGLASGVVGQTITISGNWGYSGATNSIATAKGWTVA